MLFFLGLKVSVVFDGDYDRIPHPDINLENSVSEVNFKFVIVHV